MNEESAVERVGGSRWAGQWKRVRAFVRRATWPYTPEGLPEQFLNDQEVTELMKSPRALFVLHLYEALAHGLLLGLAVTVVLVIVAGAEAAIAGAALVGLVAVALAVVQPVIPQRWRRMRPLLQAAVGMAMGAIVGFAWRMGLEGATLAALAGGAAGWWLGRLCRFSSRVH